MSLEITPEAFCSMPISSGNEVFPIKFITPLVSNSFSFSFVASDVNPITTTLYPQETNVLDKREYFSIGHRRPYSLLPGLITT